MVGLITLGLIVNYLARNTLSVAAPSMMKDLDFGPAQYSQIVVAWQLCYAFMQPVAGTVVDAIGTKLGFAAFALAWSLVCAAAALATGWRSLAFLRGLLGLTEAAGFPAGVKATTEWFPERERSVAIGWFNAGTSIGIPRILSEPAWQTFNAWIPLYMMTERHMNLKEVALFAWLPFLAADIGCVLGGYLSPIFVRTLNVSWLTSRKLVVLTGAICMIGPACVGLVASPYTAIALLCVGGFAHQTLSGGLYSVTSDVFGKNEVASATGLGGMMGYLGAAAFTALFGIMVTQVGYGPLFAVLAVFDLIGAAVVFALAHKPGPDAGVPAGAGLSDARSAA
jgi:MFS family permease